MNEQTRELAAVHDAVLAAWGVSSRFVEAAAGERVHVLEHGDGPPLVILHGSGPTSLQLLPLVSRITRSRAVAIDRPGFGLSDLHQWSGPRRKAAVGWLDLVLDALGLRSVNLLGSSAGGTWAIWYALASPDRVQRLVLVGAPPALSVTTPPAPLRMVASIDPANPPQMPPPSRETVGFVRYPGSSALSHFVQHTWDGASIWTQNYGTVASGVTQTYRVQYTGGCVCFQFFINGGLKTSTWWSPYSYWLCPFTSFWGSRLQRLNSDPPGTASSPLRYTLLKVQDYQTQNFENADPNPPPPQFVADDVANQARWELGGVSGLAFNIWCFVSCGP